MDETRLDVVGIGAFNVDLIVDARSLDPGDPAGDGTPLELGTERSVGPEAAQALLDTVGQSRLDASLGGSAFNTVVALASLRLGHRLGFVGVAGNPPAPPLSAVHRLNSLGIDTSAVLVRDDVMPGICFSLQQDGERTLLTHAGANALMADHLDREHDALVEYLAGARIVHVTSFLDPRTPDRLLRLLTAVKRRNGSVVISFDPGHEWATARTRAVLGIARLSDYLFVNQREFEALGHGAPSEPDGIVARRLLTEVLSEGCVILVKRAAGTHCYRADNEHSPEFSPQQVLAEDEIEDATGAGDVFAAGVLVGVAGTVGSGQQPEIGPGVLLGMRLARHKLTHLGSRGHSGFAEIADGWLRSRNPVEGGGA